MALAQARGVHSHPFIRGIDGNAKRGNSCPRGAQTCGVSRRRYQDLSEIEDADHARGTVTVPSREEPTCIRMMIVAGIERTDVDIRFEHDVHRRLSSRSRCSR